MRTKIMLLPALVILGASSVAVPVLPVPTAGAAVTPTTTAYQALPEPVRLLDTRDSGPPVAAGSTTTVTVTGDAPLPALGTAQVAVLNVTIVGPARVGFWTVHPGGTPRPVASNLNIDERASMLGVGLTVPNLVTVPIGADGTVAIFSQSGGHIVVDMLGSYVLSGETSAGRLQPLTAPARLIDTRESAIVPAQSVKEVRVPNPAGAGAAVVNVTTIASAAGYWTVFPAGNQPPRSSNLNSIGPFHVVANQAIVPLDGDGDFAVFSQSGGHLVVDLVALITGPTAPVTSEGLFVPLPTPTRFLDTREPALNPLGGRQPLLPGWNLEVPVASHPALAGASVGALALNVTVTEALREGYVSVGPAGSSNPAVKSRSTSTMNVVRAAQTLPNHATVAVSPRGFDVFVQGGAHVIADVSGYYLGAPVPAPFGGPANVNPTPFGCVGHAANPVGEIVLGSSPASVVRAQQRLLDLGFWLSGADGSYGLTTTQAVTAFQKWNGLPRTGRVDETTAATLNRTLCRPAPTRAGRDLFIVDKGRQVAQIVRDNRVLWVLNVSTGGGYAYTGVDKKTGARISDVAITRSGTFRVYRVSDDPRYFGSLGELYRPRFFDGGIAVHGYRSVPSYPASHGCVRVTNPAMDLIWNINAMPMGSTVIVHD